MLILRNTTIMKKARFDLTTEEGGEGAGGGEGEGKSQLLKLPRATSGI